MKTMPFHRLWRVTKVYSQCVLHKGSLHICGAGYLCKSVFPKRRVTAEV